MKIKEKIFDAIKGFFVGMALLIPGVSGGTIALLTKIYDKMVDATSKLARHFWSSFKVLLPIGIGVLIALVSLWIPLKYATQYILFAMICLFAGSMVGGMPDITDKVKGKPFKKRYIAYLIIAIGCGALFGILSYHCNLDASTLFNPINWKTYLIMIPIGFIASAGIVVPGISGSMMLLVLGFYSQILGLIDIIKTDPSKIGSCLGVLGCMAVGVILGMICFSKLMKTLLNKFNTATYIWIIGMVTGSIFSLFYNHDIMAYYINHGIPLWEGILGGGLLIVGFIISYSIVRYQRKKKTSNE